MAVDSMKDNTVPLPVITRQQFTKEQRMQERQKGISSVRNAIVEYYIHLAYLSTDLHSSAGQRDILASRSGQRSSPRAVEAIILDRHDECGLGREVDCD